MNNISILTDVEEIRRVSNWLEIVGAEHSVPASEIERLNLCLHEVLANVIFHGFGASVSWTPSSTSTIDITFEANRIDGEAWAQLSVSDAGPAFDPLEVKKTLPTTLSEGKPGGLGMVMVRKFSDALTYQYLDGRNNLTFKVIWKELETKSTDPAEENLIATGGALSFDEQDIQFISQTPLFLGVGKKIIEEMLAESEILELPAGMTLIRPNEENHNIYLLLTGQMIVNLDAQVNLENGISILPGQLIGESSVIDNKATSALVTVVSNCRVIKLSEDTFWNHLIPCPGIALNLMRIFTKRMRLNNDQSLKALRKELELEYLKKDLDSARQLQASMLPLQRPIFPERMDIEVCGLMEPASDVGGDLFDTFFIDDQHLFICIGDVSGHGIASAIFMARIVGLLRELAISATKPEQILKLLNDRLCMKNDGNIFVTMFCGILEVSSGKLVYSNAGHIEPFLSYEGDVRLLPLPKGVLIGAFPNRNYTSLEYQLRPGELLLCYTDGITEAKDPEGNEFLEERCFEHLASSETATLPIILDKLCDAVKIFSKSEVFEDDCTMLGLRLPVKT